MGSDACVNKAWSLDCGSPLPTRTQRLPAAGRPAVSHAGLVAKACVSRPLLLQVLQKDKMAEAYSEIGLKGEVRAALGPQVGPGDGEAPRELLLLFQIHLL